MFYYQYHLSVLCINTQSYRAVCAYVCVYIHTHVCTSFCLSVCPSFRLSVRLSVCRQAGMYVCKYAQTSQTLTVCR